MNKELKEKLASFMPKDKTKTSYDTVNEDNNSVEEGKQLSGSAKADIDTKK